MINATNNIELITKFITEGRDEVYKANSFASILDNAGRVRFSADNARTVMVSNQKYGGLRNYQRNNEVLGADVPEGESGYQMTGMATVWETRTISQDIAAAYPIEDFDNEETGGISLAATIRDVTKQVAIPDIDAYCFSEIAAQVKKLNPSGYKSGAFTVGKYLAALDDAYFTLDSNEVPQASQIVFASTSYINALRSTPELYRRLDAQGDIGKKVSFKIVAYEGRPVIVVPPTRFKEGFKRRAQGGFTFTGSDIDFIAMDRGAAVHVVKYDKQKVLTGDAALAFSHMDSTVVLYRCYHDLFVFDNSAMGIYVHVGGLTNSIGKADFSWAIDGNGILTNTVESPRGVLTYYYTTTKSLTTENVGDKWTVDKSKDTKVSLGDAFAAGTKTVVGVQGGEIIGVKTLTVTGTAPAIAFTLADKAA